MFGFVRFALVAFVFLSVSACGPGSPGYISKSTSTFDGTTQLTMEPAWLYDSPIKMALFKNTKMNEGDIVLTAVVSGTHTFASGKSLHFNVDGDMYSFESLDSLTDINTSEGFVGSGIYIAPSNWSSKDYRLTTEFINLILNAERVAVKIDLRKTFVEGLFSTDFPTTARPAFKEFMAKLQTL